MYVSTVDPACCRTGHLILVYLHPQAPESWVYCNRWKNGPPITECKTNTEAVTKDWEENRNAVDEARKRLNLELLNCLARVHVHYGLDFFFCPVQGICCSCHGWTVWRAFLRKRWIWWSLVQAEEDVPHILSRLELLLALLRTIPDRSAHFYLNHFKPLVFDTSTVRPHSQGRSLLYARSLIRELNVSTCARQ